MAYVSRLIGARVTGPDGTRFGRIRDVVASAGAGRLPQLEAVVVEGGRRFAWDALVRHRRGFRLTRTDAPDEHDDVISVAGLLDRQILDARGMKVVRVNDVQLETSPKRTVVTGVDVGARGFLRRLGIERPAVALSDALGYALPDTVIAWTYVASLEGPTGVRLGIDRELLAKLRPVEVAELLDALDPDDRARILEEMDDRVLAHALWEASPDVREETLDAIGDRRSAVVLELMAPDEAVDVLGALPAVTAERLLLTISPKERARMRDLLGYHPRTAGGLMTPDLVAVAKDAPAGDAVEILRSEAPGAESVYYVYAVDEDRRLRGVVPLRDLLTVPPDERVHTIARDVVRARVDEPAEDVAELMERYDLLALPVVDDRDVLLGIITVDDIMRTIEDRATDELASVTGAGDDAAVLGRLGGLAASITAGLAAALALLHADRPRVWFLAGMIPLLLRLAQDQASWALATHLEERSAVPGRAVGEVASSALAVVLPAAALGAGAAIATGVRVAVTLAAASVLSALVASGLGILVPELLAATGRSALLRRGRLVPLASSLGGLAVYVVLIGVG